MARRAQIYAPWCGFCQSFESTYRQIGEHYQAAGQADGVRVAKMDGTTNVRYSIAGIYCSRPVKLEQHC
jgi:thiol-disulfide isomerase/thioredoxin